MLLSLVQNVWLTQLEQPLLHTLNHH